MPVRPRIAVAGVQHESNSFAPFGATFSDFRDADGWPKLTSGQELLDVFPPQNIPISGVLRSTEIDCVPIVWASAEPSGPVADDAFEKLSQLICGGIAAAGALDGIYLDLHGAMVTDSYEDGEGELLRRLRAIVGQRLPIIASLDMHANVTAAMVELTDAMAIYRTYPHVDMAATGTRCVQLMLERLRLGRPFEKRFGKAPFLVPLSAQCTTVEPNKSLYASLPGIDVIDAANLVSVDVAAGFPPADIYECGPSVVAYGVQKDAVDRAFEQVFAGLLDAETTFQNPLIAPEEAIATAMRIGKPGRPVVLADVQDNPGCGGTSDTTAVIQALIDAGVQRAAVSAIWDKQAAAAAHAAGVGAEIELQLGGRYGYDAAPLRRRFRVEALSNGELIGNGPVLAGGPISLGPMASLRVLDTPAGVRVVVCVLMSMMSISGSATTSLPAGGRLFSSPVAFAAALTPFSGSRPQTVWSTGSAGTGKNLSTCRHAFEWVRPMNL